jgi:hypothetical protein
MEYVYNIRSSEVWSRWPVKPGIKYPGPETHDNNGFYNYDPNVVLRDDLLASMHSIGLEPDSLNVFYTSPGKIVPIHVDGFNPEDENDTRRRNMAAINWVYTKFPWKMVWYSSAGPGSEYEHISDYHFHDHEKNVDHRPYSYTRYVPEKMNTEFETFWKTNPVLIRTNIPHNVVMLETGTRWCVSVRFKTDNYDYIKEVIKTNLHNGYD